MYRMNEQQENVITVEWLNKTVDEQLIDVNKLWPYLTLRGFIKDEAQDEAASIQEVIKFMNDKGYNFICVSNIDEDGCKDIVFKYKVQSEKVV